MDIDNQDELLVEYDDGDAQMGVEPDAEVIVVEEGDAEMVDEEENIDDNDTPMIDDAVAMTLASSTGIVLEETEIDMRPVEEENDGDTSMREDQEESNGKSTEQQPISTSAETLPWPPAPTDVPAVPSLLPSALAVPQENRHEEGKIHDGAKTSSPPSIIAEPAATDPSVPNPQLTLSREEHTESNVVEPAFSVRGSDMGTINEDRNGTTTAATSVHGGDAETTNEAGKWPPAPTEVPAVPSMLPTALSVPDAATEDGAHEKGEAGREEASVVAEPAGSVGAEAAQSVKVDGVRDAMGENVVQKTNGDIGDAGKEEQQTVQAGSKTDLEKANGDVDEAVEEDQQAVQADDNLEDSKTDVNPSEEMPIVLVISDILHQPLFAPLPSDLEYELDEPVGPPILAGMAVDVYGAALSEVFQGLRDALARSDDAFSVKRGKEMVLEQQELSLRVGEDNKYAGEITLQEIVQLYKDCNGEAPMVLHLHHDSPRFIEWYKMTRAFADNLQLQQREHGDEEYDDGEGDIYDGDEEGGETSAEVDEGETVYVDAQEDDLGVDEFEFDEETQEVNDGEVEEDELALDTSDGVIVVTELSVKQADRGVTEEIVDYEEDELVVAPAADGAEDVPEEDQFGVDAAIRAAEEEVTVAAPTTAEPTARIEDSTPAKRSRDDEEPNDVERQVKRKLSDAGDAVVEAVAVIPDDGKVLEETS